MNEPDLRHRRFLELATEAEARDEPFGSVLVAADGTVLAMPVKVAGMGTFPVRAFALVP